MSNNVKEKTRLRFQVSKRTDMQLWKKSLITLGSIVFALLLGVILIAAIGKDPFKYFIKLITGPFKDPRYLTNLLSSFIPLLIVSLGISVAFKMKFWNIGAEGQFLMGAFCAYTVALSLGDKVPQFAAVLLVLLAGTVGGGLYGAFVAVLKAAFNVNETLLTLMLNYIMIYLFFYLLNNKVAFFIRPDVGLPTFKVISESTRLHVFEIGTFKMDTSIFFAIGILLFLWIYLKFTKQGYQISVVGDSPNTAKYAGMKVKRIMIRTIFLSACLIGLAGALKLTGAHASNTIGTSYTGGIGWTGIIVAWLAKLNPFTITLVSFLISVLKVGTSVANQTTGVSLAFADILQGLILFSVIGFDFFITYKVTIKKEVVKKENKNVEDDNNNSTKETENNEGTITIEAQSIEEETSPIISEDTMIPIADNLAPPRLDAEDKEVK